MKCYFHKDCFYDWKSKYRVLDHIATDELKPYIGEPIGPCTAIARIHTLRNEERFAEADAVRDRFNISIFPGGYICFEVDRREHVSV